MAVGRRWVVGLCASFLGCAGALEDPEQFSGFCRLDVQREILIPSCGTAGCHEAGSQESALDLVSPGLPARLLEGRGCEGRPLVDADGGVFMEKLGDSPPCGSKMPLEGPELTEEELACLAQYVHSLTRVGQ